MLKTIAELRLAFAKLDPGASGRLGEGYARKWLTTNHWQFEEIDQSRNTLPTKLRALGGKRPDFVVDSRDESIITTVDAKFASTNGGKSFAMPDWEIEKYRKFKAFAKEEFPGMTCEVFFMIFPKEHDGLRLVWIDLCDFDTGDPTIVRGEPGTAVSLEDRRELWCNNEP